MRDDSSIVQQFKRVEYGRTQIQGASHAPAFPLCPGRRADLRRRWRARLSRPPADAGGAVSGGRADIVARVVAQKLSSVLGQAVVIENRAGAAGQMGAASVAKAKPDGYTIGVVTVSTHGTAPNLYSTIPYDALKDFTPISNLAGSPSVIAVHPSVPARTL